MAQMKSLKKFLSKFMILYPTFEMDQSFRHGFIELQSTNPWILFVSKREKKDLPIESNPRQELEDKERKQILIWAFSKQ
jgi:hypothetical protein